MQSIVPTSENLTLSINDLNISDSYFFIFVSTLSIQQYFAVAQLDTFLKVEVTFIEGQNRNVSDARVYIQEYPKYGTNPDGKQYRPK